MGGVLISQAFRVNAYWVVAFQRAGRIEGLLSEAIGGQGTTLLSLATEAWNLKRHPVRFARKRYAIRLGAVMLAGAWFACGYFALDTYRHLPQQSDARPGQAVSTHDAIAKRLGELIMKTDKLRSEARANDF